MKKFISLLLALSMVFALCGVTALAADPGSATVKAVVNTDPTTDGAVGDPANIQKDDIFEVVVKFDNLTPQQIVSFQIFLGWDPTVVQPVNSKGLADNNGKPWPAKQLVTMLLPETDDDGYDAFVPQLTVADNYIDGTYYLSTDSQYSGVGYPFDSNSVELYSVRFKAIGTGKTGIKVLEKTEKGMPSGAYIGDNATKGTLSIETIDIVVQGDEPAPSDIVIAAYDGEPIVVEKVEDLPTELTAKDDKGADVQLKGVTWNTENVKDGEGEATAILPEGYVYAEGFVITATVKKPEVKPSTVVKSVTTDIPDEVSDINELPAKVEVVLDDDSTATLDVTWTAGDDGVITGTIEGYDTEAVKDELKSQLKKDVPGPEPEVKKVSKILTTIPDIAASPAELPTEIEVEYENGDTETISVKWDYDPATDTYFFSLPENVEFADSVTDADGEAIDVTGGVVSVPAAEDEHAVNLNAQIKKLASGGYALYAAPELNEEYTGTNRPVDNKVVVFFTLFNKDRAPVGVDAKVLTLGAGEDVVDGTISIDDVEYAVVSAVTGIENGQVVFEHINDNPETLGTGVGHQVVMVAE